jgi:hypothetical protein
MNRRTDGATLIGYLLDSESFLKGLAMPELFQHNTRARGCSLLQDAVGISVYMVRGHRMVGEYCDMTPESQNSEIRVRLGVHC